MGSLNSVNRLGGIGCIVLSWLAISIAGCEKPAPPTAPTPAVTIANPVQREVIEWDTFTGHLEAKDSVNLMARVSGLIMDAPFKEGGVVKEGDLLFVIDERPYKADVEAKKADVAKAQAQLQIAQVNLDRQEQALKGNAVSQQDYDNAKATRDQAAAVVESAKAAQAVSELNLEWCHVTAPVAGRVSDKLVTVGNLVNGGVGQATMLTTIQSLDPIYCYVDVDENSVLKYQKLAAEKKRVSARDTPIPCYLRLSNETGYPHVGMVDFVDNHVDPTTGTERARGIFPNPRRELAPGFFASIRVPGSGRYQALLIPDTAVGSDQDRKTVLVVGADNKVEVRMVEIGALFGQLRSILTGLKPDDKVIINGQMHVRPGVVVAPTQGTITVDPSAFADPGTPSTQELPATQPVQPIESATGIQK